MSFTCPDAISAIDEALDAYKVEKSPPDTQDDDGEALAALVERVVFALDDRGRALKALRDFIKFAEYHELRKLFPRIETQLCEFRAVIVKAGEQL